MRVVTRERNKRYYRVLHAPIWIWVFFILPGHLTFDLYTKGPDSRHWTWLAIVTAVVAWRGFQGKLPGVEARPYITEWGVYEPNLGYRVVCYTAAWIDLTVPYALNLIGVIIGGTTGVWNLAALYQWLYYPLALAFVIGTWRGWTPRARRTVFDEGFERGWFYVFVWMVVPAQVIAWFMWRMGPALGVTGRSLDWARLAAFVSASAILFWLGYRGTLPRTARYIAPREQHQQQASATA